MAKAEPATISAIDLVKEPQYIREGPKPTK